MTGATMKADRAHLTAALAAALCAVGGEARAWSYDADASLSAPCPAGGTALQVIGEDVEFDCRDSDLDGLSCRVIARYTVHNPTASPQHAALGDNAGAFSLDGAAPSSAVELALAPGARAVLVQRVERRDEIDRRWFRRWYEMFHGGSALGLMHPLLAQDRDDVVRISLSYAKARRCVGAGGWAGAGLASVHSRAPRGWAPTTGYEQHGLCRAGAEVACTQLDETDAAGVHMSYERPVAGDVRSGGVTVGLGGTTGQGFRARLGYEFGIGRRVVGAASVEVDTSGNVVLAPAIGVAIPLWRVTSWRQSWFPGALVPWVGAPLGVAPDLRGGVRGQLSLLWVFAGIDTAVDYYPVDGRTDVTVMLRFGI